jgi:type II secretory pathway pseudopilin PulG
MHQSILGFERRRYLKIALALCAVSLVAYLWHDPRSPPNGGTWLGYTLGGLGAALILWLTALGVRKRSYTSTLGSLQGWVSAHVYLGLALLLVVSLHAGFQFGWNIHTLCYVLMVVVIASGLVGIVLYQRMPQQLSQNRAQQTSEQMLAELQELDERTRRVAANASPDEVLAIEANIAGTRIGGSTVAILSAQDRSTVRLPDGPAEPEPNPGQARILEWLSARLSASDDAGRTRTLTDLVSLIGARRALLRRLQQDARLRGWLSIWLYVHVPVTFGLLGSLIAHVVSVFLYW